MARLCVRSRDVRCRACVAAVAGIPRRHIIYHNAICRSVATTFRPRTRQDIIHRVSTARLIQLLRIGGALCFVGHGAFGVMTRASWLPYFALFGINHELAYRLMPIVGFMDIALGLSLLVTVRPALLAWMVVWTVQTAAVRPMSGEPVWEMLERAGNYGVPIALLMLVWPGLRWRDWLAEARPAPSVSPLRVQAVLVGACVLLLVGHGMLALQGKPALVANLAAVLPAQASSLTPTLGIVELALAVGVLVAPSLPLMIVVTLWKLTTESLFLVVGASFWELVERGGSFVVPMAIAALLLMRARRPDAVS